MQGRLERTYFSISAFFLSPCESLITKRKVTGKCLSLVLTIPTEAVPSSLIRYYLSMMKSLLLGGLNFSSTKTNPWIITEVFHKGTEDLCTLSDSFIVSSCGLLKSLLFPPKSLALESFMGAAGVKNPRYRSAFALCSTSVLL